MTQQQLVLVALSLGSTAALAIFPVFRDWWGSIRRYPFESLLLILLFIGILFLGGERAEGETELLDTSRMMRIVLYVSITGLATLRIFLNPRPPAATNSAVVAMFAYGLIAMGTAIYSVFPLLSLWKGFEVITHVSVAAIIARQAVTVEDANRLLGVAWLILAYLIASLLWGALLYPEDAFRAFLDNTGAIASEGALGKGLRGTFPKMHLNSVTQIGAMVSIAAIAYLASLSTARYKRPLILLLLASLTVVVFGHSRTSIVGFGLACLVFALYLKNRTLRFSLVTGILALAAGVLVSDFVTEYFLRGQTEEQVSGWNGRIALWTALLKAVSDAPLFGHGFYAGTRVLFGIPGADNAYLTVLIGGGAFLLVAFLVPVFIVFRQLFLTRPSRVSAADDSAYRLLWTQSAGLFVLILMRSISGPSFDANHFNLILFLLCSVGAACLVRNRSMSSIAQRNEAAPVSLPREEQRILARKRVPGLPRG